MAQPITIVGTITDSSGISKQVTITGIGSVVVDPGYGVGTPVPPHPAHPIYTPPVFPSHPIVLPTPPVDPGYGVPAPPLGIWGGAPPPHPAHPIAPGGPGGIVSPPIYYPPGIWPSPPPGGGVPQPPGGIVAPPIYYPPVFPAHPIVTPPVGIAPPIYYPPGIWGPTDPRPSHPIVLPEPPEVPTEPPIAPPGGGISDGWQWYYTPGTGWILVWKPPGSGGKPQPPGGSAPTPSPTKG